MDKQLQKEVLRARRAGYQALQEMAVRSYRKMSVAQRLLDMETLAEFAERVGMKSRDDGLPPTWPKWQKLREEYGRRNQN